MEKSSRKITSEISEQIREKTFVLKTLLSSIKIEPTRKNIIKAKALKYRTRPPLPEHRAEVLDTRSSGSCRGRVVANACLGWSYG